LLAPTPIATAETPEPEPFESRPSRRTGLVVLAMLVIAAAVAALVLFRPGKRNPENPIAQPAPAPSASVPVATTPPQPSAPEPASGSASAVPAPEPIPSAALAPSAASSDSLLGSRAAGAKCKASLVLDGAAAGSELLVRVGAAPIEIPLSGAPSEEVVAVADGFVPRRQNIVLPHAGKSQDAATRPPEVVSIRLEKAERPVKKGVWEPWPQAAQPRGNAAHHADHNPPLATSADDAAKRVRVVTNPKAADIWMSLGRGPSSTVAGLPCAAPVDVLVVGDRKHGSTMRRVQVPGSVLSAGGDKPTTLAHFSLAP
jgi:hypothetical protein